MNTLADQVVEFTITLVRAFTRVGQYDPTHTNYARVRARLYKELARLLRTQPEIGYVLGPPAVAGAPPEIWVDGTAPDRVELRRLVIPSIGGGFILQLLEFLQPRGIAAIAFPRGITEAEWNDLLVILAEDVLEKSPAQEGHRLARALLEKQVHHLGLVCEADLPTAHADTQWMVRIAYARLARDLRTYVVLGKATPATIMDHAEALVSGMASSYFRRFEVLRPMLFQADAVDAILRDLPPLKGVHGLDVIVRGLPLFVLLGTQQAILKESGDAPFTAPVAQVLQVFALRLLKEPSSTKVDEALRTLCRRSIIPMTQLPMELQEWVLAETWVDSLATDMGKEPPKGSAEIKPVRLLQKAARYALLRHLPVQGMGILERLKSLSPPAIPEVFDIPTVEAILGDFPTKLEDRKAVLLLLGQGAHTAAQSVATVCVTAEGKVAEAAALVLSEMKDRGVSAALRVLDRDIDQENTARLLLAVVSAKTPANAVDALIRQFKHKSPRVRQDALTAICQASPDAAETHVALALSDPDENVRIHALLLCANSGAGSEQIIPKAIALVSKAAREAPPQIVRAAIEVVVRRHEANALSINDAESALLTLATPIGSLGRIFGKQNPPNPVWVTAIAALGRLGTQKAQKLLARLEKLKDPDVAGAARMALHPKSAGAPMALMPMVDSTVVTLSLDGRTR